MAGWQIKLYNQNGLVARAMTNGSGSFGFINLTACTPHMPPHEKETMLQVNWNLVQNPLTWPHNIFNDHQIIPPFFTRSNKVGN